MEDWRAERWSQLGSRLGGMVRSSLLVVFPQEYAIDESGELRRQFLSASQQFSGSTLKGLGASSMAALLSTAALVTLRSWRNREAGGAERYSSSDLEKCVLE